MGLAQGENTIKESRRLSTEQLVLTLERVSQQITVLSRECEIASLDREQGKSQSPAFFTDQSLDHAQAVRKLTQMRHNRNRIFGERLFSDAPWDFLLDLYSAKLAGQRTSVSALCYATTVPNTTALRYVSSLERRGLISRTPDPSDRRRTFIDLTEDGATQMAACIDFFVKQLRVS